MSIGLGINLGLRGSGLGAPLSPTFGVGTDPGATMFHQSDVPISVNASPQCPCSRRIPIQWKCYNGDYLMFTDVRGGLEDASGYGIVVQRSTDKGRTYGPYVTVYNHTTYAVNTEWIGIGSVVGDYVTNPGHIWFFFTKATGSLGTATLHTVYYTKSTDNGLTWTAPVDITANVKVTDGTHPAGHGFAATAWTVCVGTCTAGIQILRGANVGRMLVPFDHRVTDFSSPNVSRSHVIKSDDFGATWGLFTGGLMGGLGLNAANDGTNECAIAETETTDRIVMLMRNVNNGFRYFSVSTNCGGTWSDAVQLTTLFGGGGSGTSGDVKQVGNLTVASYSNDRSGSDRARLALAYSTDQGATWPANQANILVAGEFAAYSGLLVDGNNITIGYESGQGNVGAKPISNIGQNYHSIQIIRTNKKYLLAPTPRVSRYYFNEEASGVKCQIEGARFIDQGNLHRNGYAGTSAAIPSYTTDGVVLTAGAADKIVICPAADTIFDLIAGDSISVEVEATVTANGVIIGKQSATAGWQLRCVGGVLEATVKDGTNTATWTGLTTITALGKKVYSFIYDGTLKTLRGYIDGVSDVVATSTVAVTGNVFSNVVDLIVGDNSGGTLSIAATIHSVHITLGVITTLQTAPITKTTVAAWRGYTPPTLAFPTLSVPFSNLKHFTYPTYNLGLDASSDCFAVHKYPMPIPTGVGVRSFIDGAASRRRFWCVQDTRRILTATDSKMGPCFDLERFGSVSGPLTNTDAFGATNGFDFIQNGLPFTICLAFNLKASTGVYQVFATTNGVSATLAGFYIYRLDGASTQLGFFAANGSAGVYNEVIATSPVISYGTTYFMALVGNGSGLKVRQYSATLSAAYNPASPTPPTLSFVDSAVNWGTAGTFNSTLPLVVGGTAADANPLNGYIKNFMIFDTNLSQADLQLLANFTVSG